MADSAPVAMAAAPATEASPAAVSASAAVDEQRETMWKVFFHVMSQWRKDRKTLELFQIVEQEYGKEWMADVVLPKQKDLLRQMLLWKDQSWQEIWKEMAEKARKYRPLPVAVTRLKERLTVGPGDVMPTFPMVDLMSSSGRARTTLQELALGSRLAVVVSGSLT